MLAKPTWVEDRSSKSPDQKVGNGHTVKILTTLGESEQTLVTIGQTKEISVQTTCQTKQIQAPQSPWDLILVIYLLITHEWVCDISDDDGQHPLSESLPIFPPPLGMVLQSNYEHIQQHLHQ